MIPTKPLTPDHSQLELISNANITPSKVLHHTKNEMHLPSSPAHVIIEFGNISLKQYHFSAETIYKTNLISIVFLKISILCSIVGCYLIFYEHIILLTMVLSRVSTEPQNMQKLLSWVTDVFKLCH